ncbi:MAG TPA: TonB-dependent receptor [Telluria sp.]|nr:TonB-dependent receptor [Telluria sp.]
MHLNQYPVLRMTVLAAACQMAFGTAHAQSASEVAPQVTTGTGKQQVVITAKKLGMGLMVTEDAPKARSTITAEELEKQRPTGNAYEALEMLPAVNSYNYDATGLFGGGLTLRGFNSDQIGATINGVPVNDSGSFSVYPQEYVDQENTCSQFVTQGSTDVDSPQVGATGGNFGINTCNPEKNQRLRLMQTIGQLDMYKTFVRYDSGLMADNRSRMFISGSRAEADKWKGKGGAKREHIDAGFNYDWDKFNYIHSTILWNEALNHNINSLTLKELNEKGYFYDFSETFPGHKTPRSGQADVDVAPNPAFYGLSANPFRNAIFSATGRFRLADNLDLKVLPYMWYGFGNGGLGQKLTGERTFLDPVTFKNTAGVDLNGDGDTLDTVIMANNSVTKTYRPGITSSINWSVANHEILGGFWYERARHGQTGTMVPVTNNGFPIDYYLQKGQVRRADGHPYQSRDWYTISTAWQFFLQDTIGLMDDKLKINIGLRTPYINRDFTGFASEGSTSPTYKIEREYHDVLPQLGARFRITNDDQLFASIAKNMKAPPNFVFDTRNNVRFINGVPTLVGNPKEETSYNTDIGYRRQTDKFIATFTAYFIDFRDRQATAFDAVSNSSSYINVGDVRNHGFEIELGNTPINGWSFYGSLGYSDSEIRDNLEVRSGVFVPTAGKQMINTPKKKASLSAEYQTGSLWARLKMKSTSRQASTMTNDEWAPGYTTFGIDGGYTFANWGAFKRPKLTVNVSNITNKQYRNAASNTTVAAANYPGWTGSTSHRYYLGAPRFASVTLSVDL